MWSNIIKLINNIGELITTQATMANQWCTAAALCQLRHFGAPGGHSEPCNITSNGLWPETL